MDVNTQFKNSYLGYTRKKFLIKIKGTFYFIDGVKILDTTN